MTSDWPHSEAFGSQPLQRLLYNTGSGYTNELHFHICTGVLYEVLFYYGTSVIPILCYRTWFQNDVSFVLQTKCTDIMGESRVALEYVPQCENVFTRSNSEKFTKSAKCLQHIVDLCT